MDERLNKSKKRKRKRWVSATKPGDILFIDSDGEYKVMETKVVKNEHIASDHTYNKTVPDNNKLSRLHNVEVPDKDSKCGPQKTEYPNSFFEFQWKPISNITKDYREDFTGPPQGPTKGVTTPYEAFENIWDTHIMQHIAEQTNIYAKQTQPEWKDVVIDELYVYFAIMICFSLCVKVDVKEYFYNFSEPVNTPNFEKYMTYDRFISLNKYLHFCDNAHLNVASLNQAKLFKIEPIINHLNIKFQSLYNLDRNITIVESFLKAKNIADIMGYQKDETISEDLKIFELCDYQTGYLWRIGTLSSDTVSTQDTSPIGPVPRFVLKLMDGLQNRGHTLFMDSFFNSPALARVLKSTGTDCMGTLRTNRQFVPPELEAYQKKVVQKILVPDQTSGDVNIIMWRDKNRTAFISTYHTNQSLGQSGDVQKPVIVRDYMTNLELLDKRDQLILTYRIEQGKGKIWYKKVFRHLFNMTLINAWILLKLTPGLTVTSHRVFRYDLVNAILEKHRPRAVVIKRPVLPKETLDHFPREYGVSTPPRNHVRIKKPCTVCGDLVLTYCQGCNVSLCAFTCHITYHS